VACAGTLAGLGLGYALGQGVVRLVTRTINDFYYVVSVVGAPLDPATVGRGVALGLGAALAAAVLPAVEAARVEPVTALRPNTLESTSKRWLPRLALYGLALAMLGALALSFPKASSDFDFPGLFAVVLGAALTVPWLTLVAMKAAAVPLGRAFGLVGSLGARTVARSVSRTGVATAALMTAVAVAIGVTLMIGSFRSTVRDWLDLTLLADLYVGAREGALRSSPSLSPALVARVAGTQGVASVETYRRVRVMSTLGEIALGASDVQHRRSLSLYRFNDAVRHPWEQVEAGDVVVSEPFAHRHRLPRHGASLEIFTDRGKATFRVAGVFYDYSSEEGVVLMSRSVYDRYWSDRDVSSIAVYVAAGAETEVVADSLRAALAGTSLQVTPTRSLKRQALRIFDRTFAVTDALRLLALIVAVIGVWNALLALQVERTRELATLSALGLTPGQLSGLCFVETGLMGLLAGVLSVPLGMALAFVLVNVINVRSFGWTMHLSYELWPLIEAVVASVAASLLAAVYPVVRLRRLPVAAALRME
jgi:putative ABC transport system permease protein